jgi:hypothetical protein
MIPGGPLFEGHDRDVDDTPDLGTERAGEMAKKYPYQCA